MMAYQEERLPARTSQGPDTPPKGVHFGAWLKAKRLSRNMTLREASSQIGVSATAFHKWESGAFEPRRANLRSLAALFDMPQSEIEDALADYPTESTKEPGANGDKAEAKDDSESRGGLQEQIARSKAKIAAAAGTTPERVRIVIEI